MGVVVGCADDFWAESGAEFAVSGEALARREWGARDGWLGGFGIGEDGFGGMAR